MTESALEKARREAHAFARSLPQHDCATWNCPLARLEAAAREEGYNAGFDKAIKAPAMCGRHDEEVIATVATDRCPGCAIDAAARSEGVKEGFGKGIALAKDSEDVKGWLAAAREEGREEAKQSAMSIACGPAVAAARLAGIKQGRLDALGSDAQKYIDEAREEGRLAGRLEQVERDYEHACLGGNVGHAIQSWLRDERDRLRGEGKE